jgi:hypothetical protein
VDAAGLGQRALGGLNIVNTHQIDDVAVLEEASVPTAHTAVTDDCSILLCHDVLPFSLRNRSEFPRKHFAVGYIIQHFSQKCKVFCGFYRKNFD